MIDEQYSSVNGEYLKNNPTWHIEDSPWKAKQILGMLHANKLSPKSIFEIGCGAGEILHQLYKALPEDVTYTGYDIAPDAYEFCLQRRKDRLNFKNEDLLKSPEKCELLMVIDVFEHVEDYLGFLRACKEKGDYKIFHIPLDISVLAIFRNSMIMARQKFGHLHYFTKETALASLKSAGYEIIDHCYTHGAIELSRTFKMKLAKLPRILLYKLNKDLAVNLLGGRSLLVLAR